MEQKRVSGGNLTTLKIDGRAISDRREERAKSLKRQFDCAKVGLEVLA